MIVISSTVKSYPFINLLAAFIASPPFSDTPHIVKAVGNTYLRVFAIFPAFPVAPNPGINPTASISKPNPALPAACHPETPTYHRRRRSSIPEDRHNPRSG